MLQLITNHKVGDEVYVTADCVRRGIVRQVNFTQTTTAFNLSYNVRYDGNTFDSVVTSEVRFDVGSPTFGSPLGSPITSQGSPFVGSPLLLTEVAVVEVPNGGGIYVSKDAALTAFGDRLA